MKSTRIETTRNKKSVRFVLRYRHIVAARMLAFGRGALVVGSIGALVLGGWRWITLPQSAGALDFTPHVVGAATSAVGVQGIGTGDLDGDGDPDIVTSGLDGVKAYENKGNFSFETHIIEDKQSERVQVLDIDGDGDHDVLVTFKSSSPSVRWFQNNGSFEFEGTELAAGDTAVAYAGDINKDGSADIVTAGTTGSTIILRRWMNNGGGLFTSTIVDSDSKVTTISISDLDGDGYRDIIIGGNSGLQRWDTTDGTTWERVDVDDTNANRTHLDTGDPNDGSTWVATVDATVNEVALYRSGISNAQYGRLLLTTTVDGKTVRITDFDNDGDLDLVVAAQDDNAVYWYEHDGRGAFSRHTLAEDLLSVYGVAVVDLDSDGGLDVVAGDFGRGTIYAYERLRARPVATAPTSIKQSTSGSGIVSFTTTLTDGDNDPTRARIQYSLDGSTWEKPWLTNVAVSSGTADLKNSNAYQIGTADAIDTTSGPMTLTVTWDTKSALNTGGPLLGHTDHVWLRVVPRDSVGEGERAVSAAFRVDNEVPQSVANVRLLDIDSSTAMIAWDAPTDSSNFTYQLYYGYDHTAVLERRSPVWDGNNDSRLNDKATLSTSVRDLLPISTYTFKLFVTDAFGNSTAAPSIQGTTTDTTTIIAAPLPFSSPTPTPTTSETDIPVVIDESGGTPTPEVTPTPTAAPTLVDNNAPLADAGPDQTVNPQTAFTLSASASFDPDEQDAGLLRYQWRQIDGPKLELGDNRQSSLVVTAGNPFETYIFSLTVRDPAGASHADTVTVITGNVPTIETAPAEAVVETAPALAEIDTTRKPGTLFSLANLLLLLLTILAIGIPVLEYMIIRHRAALIGMPVSPTPGLFQIRGVVLHHTLGVPLASLVTMSDAATAQVVGSTMTAPDGIFSLPAAAGHYTLTFEAPGWQVASTSAKLTIPAGQVPYSGGIVEVQSDGKAPELVVVLQPHISYVLPATRRANLLWQRLLQTARLLTWPALFTGVALNTWHLFMGVSALGLAVAIVYVALAAVAIIVTVRLRPFVGYIREAEQHEGLDGALVRFFSHDSGRLVAERITDARGKLQAPPLSGRHTVTVTKVSFGPLSTSILFDPHRDSSMHMAAELIPLRPQLMGALASARSVIM